MQLTGRHSMGGFRSHLHRLYNCKIRRPPVRFCKLATPWWPSDVELHAQFLEDCKWVLEASPLAPVPLLLFCSLCAAAQHLKAIRVLARAVIHARERMS